MFISIVTTLILGSLIGVVTSVSVFGFISLVKLLTAFLRDPNRTFDSFSNLLTDPSSFLIFVIALPFLVGLIVGIIRKYASDSRWHGPPDVILAVHSEKNPLDIKSKHTDLCKSNKFISCLFLRMIFNNDDVIAPINQA